MAGDYHSNSDAMDIDPISETVTNGFEDDTNKKLEFPCSSVSTHVFPFSLSHFSFPFWEISEVGDFWQFYPLSMENRIDKM